MQQYWINQNGVQAGPLTLEELRQMSLTADAYVWRSGLDDWVLVTELDELAGELVLQAKPVPEPVREAEPVLEAEPAGAGEAVEAAQPAQAAGLEVPFEAGVEQGEPIAQGVPVGYCAPENASARYAMPAMPLGSGEQRPKCPPTNMVWAILATVLCCIPTGIVAIIYAGKVSSRYQAGDYEGAERASETGAWWCIGTIIAGIVLSPIVSLIKMLAAS